MKRALMLVLGLLSIMMAGCMSPAAPAPADEVPVTVTLATGYRLQALVNAWTAADIDHVALTVYRDGAVVAGAGTTVSRDGLSSPLTLRNLRMGTTYEIRAAAYRDAEGTQLISDAAASRAQFTTPGRYQVSGVDTISVAPIAVSLPLKLRDATYSGQGTYALSIQSNFNGKNALAEVRVRLVRVAATGEETPLGSRTLSLAEVEAGQTYSLSNLKLATSYKLYADGLKADGTVVSNESKSQVAFTTPAVAEGAVEDTVPHQILPVTR